MTNVITRYFDKVESARAAKDELIYRQGLAFEILDLYESSDDLDRALSSANVEDRTIRAYQERMSAGGAVLLVKAGYKPLGVARITREVTAKMGAADLGDISEEVFVKDEQLTSSPILQSHPLLLSRKKDPSRTNFYMADWPLLLISRRKPYSYSLFSRHARMANWPLPLTNRRKPYTGSIIRPHARMARFPIPLISRREPFTGSIIGRHARMANFPLPLINRRKPYTGSLIPRHGRMANWPFPHLINGKTGSNSLMPGGPRMAAFPIDLLSDRKPSDRFAFPRHARMANFPLPLLSGRKPYSEFAFPRHARMANFPIPLILNEDALRKIGWGKDFLLSKWLGVPTVIRRLQVF